MLTRTRRTDDGSTEWSVPADAWVDTKTPHRFRCVAEGNPTFAGLISIGSIPVTSNTETAEPLGEGESEVSFSIDEAYWLLSVLPDAIAQAEKEKAAR